MSNSQRAIVIRRPRRNQPVHHGGAWKIALADFMTALMALFLVLWILSTASPAELQGLAEYFRTPLKVALTDGDRDSSSTSAIPGGGPDPVHSDGEQARIDLRRQSRPAQERQRFIDLRRRMENVIQSDPNLRDMRQQMRFEMTPDGLRVQLMDTQEKPMFELGSDRLSEAMRRVLRSLAPILNDVPNRLSISGHTDSLRYAGGGTGYSNWELSADRANASRRALVAAGLDPDKLLRVTGMGDRVPVPGSNPGDPVNRRITLEVLTDQAARRLSAASRPDSLGTPTQPVVE
ncbi:flagellar motor protein MotB [Alloalcanivorax sp. C16-2]|uniref:flagellar motor protein MotB n=1 Tax=Alloalcanivorax TaxID=3020832 RepID=UPI0019341CB5|nr:flagellar motor protein MotB [Alloalcanivorax marinus]MBL7251693.1 flagellar motor protein MotB [Alloalcanivorax marinus]